MCQQLKNALKSPKIQKFITIFILIKSGLIPLPIPSPLMPVKQQKKTPIMLQKQAKLTIMRLMQSKIVCHFLPASTKGHRDCHATAH
jgi:hypothetical protein